MGSAKFNCTFRKTRNAAEVEAAAISTYDRRKSQEEFHATFS